MGVAASSVTSMAGGYGHSLVTTREGRVLGFGSNADGRLGLGAEVQQVLTPTAIDGITVGGKGQEVEAYEGKEGKDE